MNEDFEFSWWEKIANKLGVGGILAIIGISSVLITWLIGIEVFYYAVKYVVAH